MSERHSCAASIERWRRRCSTETESPTTIGEIRLSAQTHPRRPRETGIAVRCENSARAGKVPREQHAGSRGQTGVRVYGRQVARAQGLPMEHDRTFVPKVTADGVSGAVEEVASGPRDGLAVPHPVQPSVASVA
jgi:hypothetical protein